jgi:hypothetical protein
MEGASEIFQSETQKSLTDLTHFSNCCLMTLYHLHRHRTGSVWREVNSILVGQGCNSRIMKHHSCSGFLGELVQHVVALVEEYLDAKTVADAGERGSPGHRIGGIVSRVERVAAAVGWRKGLGPVPEI